MPLKQLNSLSGRNEMFKFSQKTSAYGVAGLAAVAFTAPAAQAEWKPTDKIELIAHVKTASSTYAFAAAVLKAIKEEKLAPKGVDLRSVRGARGGKARAFVGVKNKGNPHMMQALTPSQINNPILAKSKVDYKLFRGVAMMVVTPLNVVVPANSPYKTMKDIVDDAKKNPGKIIHGGGAFGNVASLVGELWAREAGFKQVYAAFEKQGMLELLGGHIAYGMHNPAQIDKYIKAGKLRIVAASEKLGAYPNIPTFKEAGYNFPVLKQYRGWWMSKDVSDDVVNFYIAMMDKVRKSASFTKYVKQFNVTSTWVTGKDLDKLLANEYENYYKLDTELDLIGKKKK
jgi:putative tricarboxylic transport membrane protein